METGGATGDVDMGPDVDMASDDNDADLLVEVLLWERRLLKALASVSEGVQQQLTIAASIPFVVTESYAGCCTASCAFSRAFAEVMRQFGTASSLSEENNVSLNRLFSSDSEDPPPDDFGDGQPISSACCERARCIKYNGPAGLARGTWR